MSEPEGLERYLDDFGTRLADAATASRSPAPRRRHRRSLALALAVTAVAVGAVVAVLAGSGERLDPVAEARAALAPPGEIVYMKVTSEVVDSNADSVPPPQTTEQWSALDPPRWRFVQTIPRPSAPRPRGFVDAFSGRHEISYADSVKRSYSVERDRLDVTRGFSNDEGDARVPSLLGPGSGDPEADLRSMLFDGEVSDEGEQQLGGRTVRRFVSELRRDGPNDPEMVLRLVYDVDPQTFAPIEGRFSHEFPAIDDRPRTVTRLRVDEYRRIPLDDTTAQLLEIKTTPQTKVAVNTARELRERARRWREKCRPRKSGDVVCKGFTASR